MALTIIERARRCVATRPPAIENQGGHSTTFGVACVLVWGFGLSPEEAMPLMMEYNQRCEPPWNERDLWHKLRSALTTAHKEPRSYMVLPDDARGEVPVYTPPETPKKRKKEFSLETLQAVQRSDWKVDAAYLRERSPVDPKSLDVEAFLDGLFAPQERVMVFGNLKSTGDYMRWIGKGTYLLAKAPGEKAQPAKLPPGSKEGMVFLIQPVDGQWYPVSGTARMSRRTARSVTRWPYMLLESDKAPHELWLNFIAQLRMPIVAISTSAGRSLHCLAKVDCSTREEWNECAAVAMELLTSAGCDGQALQPVVYMRLPGSWREGKMYQGKFQPFQDGRRMQRLLYYNPDPSPGGCIGENPIFDHGGKSA
jgi:hypothetical protein